LARVQPVEQRLLAHLELVGHLEGGEVLHPGPWGRGHSHPSPPARQRNTRLAGPPPWQNRASASCRPAVGIGRRGAAFTRRETAPRVWTENDSRRKRCRTGSASTGPPTA